MRKQKATGQKKQLLNKRLIRYNEPYANFILVFECVDIGWCNIGGGEQEPGA